MHEPLTAYDLANRVALVTGAGNGLGRSSALLLAGCGATVICADVDTIRAEKTAGAIVEQGGTSMAMTLDVADRAAVHAAAESVVSDLGRLDVMANIAGIITQGPSVDVTENELDRILSVNLKGVLWGCQAAARVMTAQGEGSIVNMASAAIDGPSPTLLCYAIAKAGVAQMTKTFAAELGPFGVRVNTVAPGFVVTGMTGRHFTDPDGSVDETAKVAMIGSLADRTPLRRIGEPDDIAHAVLYLASDASRFVTGQILRPNGGMAMP